MQAIKKLWVLRKNDFILGGELLICSSGSLFTQGRTNDY